MDRFEFIILSLKIGCAKYSINWIKKGLLDQMGMGPVKTGQMKKSLCSYTNYDVNLHDDDPILHEWWWLHPTQMMRIIIMIMIASYTNDDDGHHDDHCIVHEWRWLSLGWWLHCTRMRTIVIMIWWLLSGNWPSGNVNDYLVGEAGVWAVDQEGTLWQRRGVGQHCPEGTMWASVCEVGNGIFVWFCWKLKWKIENQGVRNVSSGPTGLWSVLEEGGGVLAR